MAKSTTELQEMREQMAGQMSLRVEDKNAIRVVVGMGTCGIAVGARDIMRVIVDEVGAHNATHVKVITIRTPRTRPSSRSMSLARTQSPTPRWMPQRQSR